MANAHRATDTRSCGATTVVNGQNFVRVDGLLWSVNGDPNTHGGGQLIASKTYVKINGLSVIVIGDSASADSLCGVRGQPPTHCNPQAITGSATVTVA